MPQNWFKINIKYSTVKTSLKCTICNCERHNTPYLIFLMKFLRRIYHSLFSYFTSMWKIMHDKKCRAYKKEVIYSHFKVLQALTNDLLMHLGRPFLNKNKSSCCIITVEKSWFLRSWYIFPKNTKYFKIIRLRI